MISSPGFTVARIVEIIASVDPQQTVIFFSGSICIPLNCATFCAIALRKFFEPQVIAYWLISSWMALHAACFISSGAEKSGKP